MKVVTAVTRLSALVLTVLFLVLLTPSPASACGITYLNGGPTVEDCPSTPPLIASVVLGAAVAATLIGLGLAAFRRGSKSTAEFTNLVRAQLPAAATGPPQQGGYDDMAENADHAVSAENGSPRLFKRLFPEMTEVNGPRSAVNKSVLRAGVCGACDRGGRVGSRFGAGCAPGGWVGATWSRVGVMLSPVCTGVRRSPSSRPCG